MFPRFLILGFLAALIAASPMQAQKDEIHFFNDIHVLPDAPLNDAICFVCNVRADGPVNGDIVVVFGSVRIDGQNANHDVIDLFGNVRLADNSSIGEDLVHVVGPTRAGNNVYIGSDLVSLFGNLQTTASTRIIGDQVAIPAWMLLIPLFFACLFVALIAYIIRVRRRPRLVYPHTRL